MKLEDVAAGEQKGFKGITFQKGKVSKNSYWRKKVSKE